MRFASNRYMPTTRVQSSRYAPLRPAACRRYSTTPPASLPNSAVSGLTATTPHYKSNAGHIGPSRRPLTYRHRTARSIPEHIDYPRHQTGDDMKTRWRQIRAKYWIDDAAYVDCPCGQAGFRLKPQGKGECSQCGRQFRVATVVQVAPPAPKNETPSTAIGRPPPGATITEIDTADIPPGLWTDEATWNARR